MDGHRVAHAAVPQDFDAALAALTPVADDVPRQHWTQLLDGERIIPSDAGQRCDENLGSGRYGQASFVCDESRRLADERRIWKPLCRDENSCERVALRLGHEICAESLELPPRLFCDCFVHYDGVR